MLQPRTSIALLGEDAPDGGVPNKPDWKSIGRDLAAARGDRPQGEIERISGVDRQTISNYENGKVGRPTVRTLTAIANAVGYKLPASITGGGDMETVRDVDEMAGVTAYFEKFPDRAAMKSAGAKYASLRDHVNATLSAKGGELPLRTVRIVIDDMIEEHGYE